MIRAQQYNLTSYESLVFPKSDDLVNFTQQGEPGVPPAQIEIPREVLEERLGGVKQRRRSDFQPEGNRMRFQGLNLLLNLYSPQVGQSMSQYCPIWEEVQTQLGQIPTPLAPAPAKSMYEVLLTSI